ncbi:MAG: family 10 glycosylhydrolase, partial [Dinghuibacter sp.]|nr:family 10 glycosylhydrolase [Dinghuibacter sp.]
MRYRLLFICLFIFCSAAAQKKPPIKGTWVTNVASDALRSEKTIRATVANCKKNGLNNIFVVVWNGGVTMYPSQVLQRYIGIQQDTVYKGFDPIGCIVKEARKAGLKVHAWFEFGFAYAYKDTNSIWLKKYPHWAGRKNDGSLLVKNGFYWWNSLHPEPQQFISELVLEVVNKYKVDGIQGDDRLPAMPAEGGYDEYTRNLYARDHNGAGLPANPKDKNFIEWKALQLSVFAKTLYYRIKKEKPACLVTWAPSIYPWSRDEYLQNWPQWLNGGYADYIIPQLYRYKIDAYEKVLKELSNMLPETQRHKVFPG